KQATTIQEITMIKQGTKSAEEHVQSFKQCYMRSGYGEMAGIHEFKWSLNSPLLDKIMAVPDLPVTLKKWYNLAVHLDRQWRQAVTEKKTFAARSGKGDSGPSTPPASNTWQPRDPNTMDVDRNWSQHRCYNCSQTGHFARNC
ncbi:hypothetical protein AMATHDRAFT_92497, partial [Amanita thiersii Skay4041]